VRERPEPATTTAMAILVQKYGGTSVNGPERIRAVARRIAGAHAAGDDVVVVVSAMGDATDELIALAHRVSPAPNRREEARTRTRQNHFALFCRVAIGGKTGGL